jgi:hypothetical protein
MAEGYERSNRAHSVVTVGFGFFLYAVSGRIGQSMKGNLQPAGTESALSSRGISLVRVNFRQKSI